MDDSQNNSDTKRASTTSKGGKSTSGQLDTTISLEEDIDSTLAGIIVEGITDVSTPTSHNRLGTTSDSDQKQVKNRIVRHMQRISKTCSEDVNNLTAITDVIIRLEEFTSSKQIPAQVKSAIKEVTRYIGRLRDQHEERVSAYNALSRDARTLLIEEETAIETPSQTKETKEAECQTIVSGSCPTDPSTPCQQSAASRADKLVQTDADGQPHICSRSEAESGQAAMRTSCPGKEVREMETQTDGWLNNTASGSSDTTEGKKRKDVSPLEKGANMKKPKTRQCAPALAQAEGDKLTPSKGSTTAAISLTNKDEVGESSSAKCDNNWTTVVTRRVRGRIDDKSEKDSVRQKKGRNNEGRADGPRPLRAKPAAVAVHVSQGHSYAEILRKVRSVPELENESKITLMRRAQNGAIIIEVARGAEAAADNVQDVLKRALGQTASVKKLETLQDVEIRDMDEFATTEEVVEGVRRLVGEATRVTDVRVKVMRKGYGGVQSAIVALPCAAATHILKCGRIRVGHVQCRIREVPRVTRCYKCHHFGHVAANCDKTSEPICRKCGGKGHQHDKCVAQPCCLLCREAGKEVTDHLAGSIRCPILKEAARGRKRRQ